MNETIQDVRDNLETAILLGLSAGKKQTGIRKPKVEKTKRGEREVFDLGMFCPKKPSFPSDVYTFDLSSDERLYSASMDDIVVNPEAAIGRGLETGMLCPDGTFKWTKIEPMPTPRGLIALSNKPVRWFCCHWREIREGQNGDYIKRPMPLSSGRVPLMKCLVANGLNTKRETEELEEQLAISLSVFEDARRTGSFLATVEEHTRLRFPVGSEAYKDFFRLRDGYRDTPTGRKNPILHWCSKHIRAREGKVFEVSGHDRGAVSMEVGPMKLSIERNNGYADFIRDEAE